MENAKAHVMASLSDGPLTNADIREITQLGRLQVVRVMKALEKEGSVSLYKRGRASQWRLVEGKK